MIDLRAYRTARLDLAAVTSADVDVLFALNSDARVWTHFPSGRHRTHAQTTAQVESYVDGWQRDGLGYWTATLRDGSFAGVGGCATRAGVGWNVYYRFRPEAQGKGYAVELVQAAQHVAGALRPDLAIYASLLEHNVASRNLAERAGLALVWRGPDVGNPEPGAVRLVYADRELSADALAKLGVGTRKPVNDAH